MGSRTVLKLILLATNPGGLDVMYLYYKLNNGNNKIVMADNFYMESYV